MSGSTWVALDGTDPDVFTPTTCWISDVGAYIGPLPVPELDPALVVPVDAAQVTYLIVPPNPDANDSHVLGTGAYAYTVTNPLEQDYVTSVTVTGDPSAPDSGSHLFVVWFPLVPVAATADLPDMLISPFDLSPVDWVAGGLLDATVSDTSETGTSGGTPASSDTPTFTLHEVDGSLLGTLADVADASWSHALSEPGYLSCKVAEDDALFASLTPKRIIKAWWRGGCRMAARIDSSAVTLAADGRKWREFNQLPGALNMLADGIVYPDAPLVDVSGGPRWFGFMSQPGPWLNPSDWVTPIGIAWGSETDVKAGKPEGLDFPNPEWIAVNGPHNPEAAGTAQYFRRRFTLSSTIDYQILATADNNLTLYLDGQELITPDQQSGLTWRFLVQVTGTMSAGTHLLAAKVTNDPLRPGRTYNPMSLILTLQRVHANGDVYVETPIVNTDTHWKASAAAVGFRRGDVIATIFDEARAHGTLAFTTLSRGFTHTLDSNGDAWTDTPSSYSLDVMSPVLDAIGQLTETAIDVDVDFDTLTLQVFNRRGTDLSGTVTIEAGVSAKVLRVERVEAKFNTALVQKADGSYVELQDAASVAAYGRIETGLQIGSTSEASTAADVATAAFLENAHTAYTFTVSVQSQTGPQPYVDFNDGDSITLKDDEGSNVKVRVLSTTVVFNESIQQWEPTIEVTVDRS